MCWWCARLLVVRYYFPFSFLWLVCKSNQPVYKFFWWASSVRVRVPASLWCGVHRPVGLLQPVCWNDKAAFSESRCNLLSLLFTFAMAVRGIFGNISCICLFIFYLILFIYLFIYLFVCLFVCFVVCLFVCLFVYLFVCFFVIYLVFNSWLSVAPPVFGPMSTFLMMS